MSVTSKAFTLIELIIVIVIIAILAVTAIPSYTDLDRRAREAATKGVLSEIRAAQNLLTYSQLVGGVAFTALDASAFSNNQWPVNSLRDRNDVEPQIEFIPTDCDDINANCAGRGWLVSDRGFPNDPINLRHFWYACSDNCLLTDTINW